jgi:molybdopterin synthase catalytic subunit
MSTPPALQLDLRLVDGPVPYEPPPFLETGGGENAFLGRTRAEDHEVHGALRSLRYEAKASMALKVLEELARDAAGRHGLVFVRVLLGPGHACAVPWRFGGAAERGRAAQVVHSVGEVPVGQASVLVQVRACAGSAAPPAAADQRHDAAGRGGRVGAFASPG